ncbi:MAG: 2,3-bisphosphoglycerate-independent phosphoglycerate mutase [Candidatus Hadarchaeales archaeon]
MKAIMIICDGLPDRPVAALGNKTPLEVARKPNMDRIAAEGICGMMHTLGPGIPPGSDTAHLALLGHDPFKVYTGRGPFEAAGAGLELEPGDVAFRANYATVDDKLVVLDRRAGRVPPAPSLEEAVNKIKLPVKFLFKSTIGHRAVLVFKGRGLSAAVSDTDPHEVGAKILNAKPMDRTAAARKTAKILNLFTRQVCKALENHPANKERIAQKIPPANAVLVRGAGVVPQLEPLQKKFGLKGACVAAAAIVKGVCRLAGMEVVEVEGATGNTQTNLAGKIKATLKALENNDLVLLHIKAFDELGHDGKAEEKVKFIEKLDPYLGQLWGASDFLLLTADHTTPVDFREHAGDPVPLALVGPGIRRDEVRSFDERSCTKGGLGYILGRDLLPILLNLMGKMQKFGA